MISNLESFLRYSKIEAPDIGGSSMLGALFGLGLWRTLVVIYFRTIWQRSTARQRPGFLFSDVDDAKFLGKHANIPDVSNDSATFSTFLFNRNVRA